MPEYLRRVSWSPEAGLRVIVGLDYWYRSDFEEMPFSSDSAHLAHDKLFDAHQRLHQLGQLARVWHGSFDNDDDRAKERSPSYFIDFALSQGHRPEWLDWAIERGLYSEEEKVAPAAKVEAAKGITKNAVIGAFEGLHYNADQWKKLLGDQDRKWLQPARVARGDSNTSALWNPTTIALALLDKEIPIKKLDAVFVSLNDWSDEWREKSAYFRD